MVSQNWFELKDVRERNFSKSVWIPLRAVTRKISEGKYGYEGYKEDFFGTGSIAVPTEKIENAKSLGWMDIGISHQHCGYVEDDTYISAEVYKDYRSELTGIHLVL